MGILDEVEISLRELNTGYPYGLSLMLQAIGATTHDENPTQMLDPSELLDEMREKIKNPQYLAEIIKENFLNNPHWTRLTAIPDTNAVLAEQNLEKKYLENALKKMSEAEKNHIKEKAKLLAERQNIPDSPENIAKLPKISLADIPEKNKKIDGRIEKNNHEIEYQVPTNNLGYIHFLYPISELPQEKIPMFMMMTNFIGELGF